MLQTKVTLLARLVDRCSDGLAESAQPKVTAVLDLLVAMATPMMDSININAQEASTILEKLGGEEDNDEYKNIFNQNKTALEENVRILNRFPFSNYIVRCFRFSTYNTKIVISKLCRIALAQDFKKLRVYMFTQTVLAGARRVLEGGAGVLLKEPLY